MSKQDKQQDYDTEPVKYCAKCYSLKVKYDETLDSEYCGECGCTDFLEAPIEVWEEKFEKRYGHKYTVKTEDPKKTFIFKLPLDKLKQKVFKSERWKEIIHGVYPRFPGGLSKADSIILFFDTLIKNNQIDDLRMFLFKNFKY